MNRVFPIANQVPGAVAEGRVQCRITGGKRQGLGLPGGGRMPVRGVMTVGQDNRFETLRITEIGLTTYPAHLYNLRSIKQAG